MEGIFGIWQFGAPGMLAWGAAAALPILIHLWSRSRYRQETWAAMSFLIAALQKKSRRLQLEQWLLLAVRVAVLMLFALALADPRWSQSAGSIGDRNRAAMHWVIVIDGSYSMGYTSGDNSRFDEAKEIAKRRVAAGQTGDDYTLALMADPPQVVIAEPTADRAIVAREIDDLQLSDGGSKLAAALAEIEQLVRRIRTSEALQVEPLCHVMIITDLQHTTWGAIDSSECRSELARLNRLASVELVDVGAADASSLAITQLDLNRPATGLLVAGQEVQFQIQIRNFGPQDQTQQPLQVLVNGVRIADERIDCPAGGSTTFSTKHRFETPGEYIFEARLADDDLSLDNRRWLSVQVREAVRVLCIGGQLADTSHLALAFRPNQEASPALTVVQATASHLLDRDLRDFDCVVLSNIGRFSANEAAALNRFVRGGGGALILFLGDQVQPDNYSQLLAAHPPSRVLPATLDEAVPTGNYRLDPVEYRHPLLASFRGFPQSGLLTTPVWKYVRLKPLEGASTVLAFDSGDPAIVEAQVGRGRCLLVATAASTSSLDRTADPPSPWTALPTWPSFPPLLHEMLRFALSHRGDLLNVMVGDELVGEISSATAETTVMVSGPDGEEHAAITFDGHDGHWRYGPTNKSGIYHAKYDSNPQRYAVNVDTRESNLTRLDSRLLPPELQGRESSASAISLTTTSESAFPLFRYLLAAVVALLITEPWLACLFGRGRG